MVGEHHTERPRDFGSLMTGLARVSARSAEDTLADRGYAWLDYAILRALLEVRQSTASQLSHLLPVEMSSISRSVATLADKRLVRRRRVAEDRRVVTLSLTADGRAAAEELQAMMDEQFAALLSGIDERDIEGFVTVTHGILNNYQRISRSR